MADQHPLTDLERDRQARIARNQAMLAQLEVPAAAQQLAQGIAAEAQAQPAARHAVLLPPGSATKRARSGRQAAKAAAQKLAASVAAAGEFERGGGADTVTASFLSKLSLTFPSLQAVAVTEKRMGTT
jgi:hypothetical protein